MAGVLLKLAECLPISTNTQLKKKIPLVGEELEEFLQRRKDERQREKERKREEEARLTAEAVCQRSPCVSCVCLAGRICSFSRTDYY